MSKERMTGDERRNFIIELLKNSTQPIPGKMLADKTNVSRQVIVTDIALLKTGNLPIIGTNRGYLYIQEQPATPLFRRVIVCQHQPDEARSELETIVDHGVTVVDVSVEHPFYGELTGSLMISSRFDVDQFIQLINRKESTLLSELTDGIHLHTLEADSEEKLDLACEKLTELGFMLTDNI